VCVVGSGGREHALASTLARTAEVVVTPGNAGIAGISPAGHRMESSAGPPESIDADLYVIGPEAALVEGLADRLRSAGHLVFGPGADGAALEGSKGFMKELCLEAGVPTARFSICHDIGEASAFLRSVPGPYVVKTDGLAAGKGVLVTADLAEAEADAAAKLAGESCGGGGGRRGGGGVVGGPGAPGPTVVIEEFRAGEELSLLVICDGTRTVALPPAKDFKRLATGDNGPNTGGMGAFSPVPSAGDAVVDDVMARIVEPTVNALRARGIDYRGVLYAGLMITAEGPRLVEYNVRFGDPEAQVVLPRVDDDLAGALARAAAGNLGEVLSFKEDAAVCVVCAAPGYPSAPVTGEAVEGLDIAGAIDGVTVFHAGTRRQGERIVTAGGRVLGVTAIGADLGEARARAYRGVGEIRFPGMQFRDDIAQLETEGATA
jgi:phosphoribosylamine--glycine ligase